MLLNSVICENMQYDNRAAPERIKLLVEFQRLSASGDRERYLANFPDFGEDSEARSRIKNSDGDFHFRVRT
jgi:hypothetical protein